MSIGIQKTFNLDMVPGGAPPIIHVSAEDVGRPYRANLQYNGEVYEVQGNRLTIAGTKPDGTVFEYPVDDFEQDESYADFTIKEQMAIVPGVVRCKLREYLNDDQIGSATFIIDVDEYVYDPEAASESYIPTYETAIQEALETVADDIADLATAGAIESVSQYATSAASSASTAQTAAGTAQTAANNAQTSATSASGSATSAAESATSATSAKTAAETAQTAAEGAATRAEDAADSIDVDTVARIDGSYDDMTVGNAKQLESSVFTEDKVPYLFRTSGGSADIGNREYDTIVGGTVAWNQLADGSATGITQYGITLTRNNDGSYTLSGTATGRSSASLSSVSAQSGTLLLNHVYYCKAMPASGFTPIGSGNSVLPYAGVDGIRIDKGNGGICKHTGSYTSTNLRIDFDTGVVFDNAVVWPQWIDLTQMFGSTIADYIYSLEQATAGAGVAWFRQFFPDDYYAYNAGELMSVEDLQSHDTVGFNLWDEEWEIGDLDSTTGGNANSSARLRSKNFIKVVSGQSYYFYIDSSLNYTTTWVRIAKYDENKAFLSMGSVTPNSVFSVADDVKYIKFATSDNWAGKNYNGGICINLSWSGYRNGEYEPYKKYSYPLDDSLTLRGIPKLDANNELYYDGDTYEADGTVTRKYGIVDLGTLTWTYDSANTCFYSSEVSDRETGTNVPLLTWKYLFEAGVRSEAHADKTIFAYNASNRRLCIKDTAYNDAAAFKTALSGIKLVYPLTTPTTETAEPFQTPQFVDDSGTEEYVTTSIVPVGHVTKYPANLRDKLQHLPDLASTNGDYIIRQSDSQMVLTPLTEVKELPDAPSGDGTYTLVATVSNGEVTYSWVSQ